MRRATFILLFLLLTVPCEGGIITVDDDGPADYNNIQAAIDDSNNGDIIEVQPGVYTGDGNRDIDFLGKAITVRNTEPNDPNIVATTIIDCEGIFDSNDPNIVARHRGFYFHSGEDSNSIVNGFTIINGIIPGDINFNWGGDPCDPDPNHVIGGGIYCALSSPTIINCVIRNCITEVGGGIGCYNNASPVIIDCTITECNAGGLGECLSGGRGVGIGLISGSNATITNCTITNNNGYYNSEGGGIFCKDSGPKISKCTISSNSATGNIHMGGGVCFNGFHPDMRLENCVISQNTGDHGAGIMCYESNPIITHCIINGNIAGVVEVGYGYGGGIYSGTDYYGGSSSSATITNCTITGNIAGAEGGGIMYCKTGNNTLTNCIIWGNSDPEISGNSDSDPVVTYSAIEGGWPGLGNINVDPCFADTSSLDANQWDYHLQSAAGRWDPNSESWVIDANTSDCIDAGNPGCPVGSEPMPNGNRTNMGAYGGTPTASKSPADWRSIADLTNDWVVDFNDLAVFVDYWLGAGECVPSDLNRSEFANFADYAIFADNWRVE